MKFLTLISDGFAANGGIAKYNRDLLLELVSQPSSPIIVALVRHQTKPVERELPVNFLYNTRGANGKFFYFLELIRVLLNHRTFDYVLCGHINLLPIAFLVSKIYQVPLWCLVFGIDVWEPHPNIVVRWLIGSINGYITISDFTKAKFQSWAHIPDNKFYLLPNSYDDLAFFPEQKPSYLVERYNLDEKIVILTLGRLVSFARKKGFDEVIETLPSLLKKIPNLVYLIAGKGKDQSRLQRKVQTMGLSDHVIFTGYVEDKEKADHYRLADAYVMPSEGEGFGFVFLEAMACGVPVLGSKLDGSREALRDGKLGVLVDPRIPEEIHDGILDVLSNKSRIIPDGLEYFHKDAFKYRVRLWFDSLY